MTIQEFYQTIDGNYDEALLRLGTESLLLRIVKLFSADPSMNELNAAISEQDAEKAFRSIHTLKGVALNLSFNQLAESGSELTELLRNREFSPGWEDSYNKLKIQYQKIISALSALKE